jgi:hypothetical protein
VVALGPASSPLAIDLSAQQAVTLAWRAGGADGVRVPGAGVPGPGTRQRVVSKQELADYLYPHDEDRDSNVLEVLIGRLRRKLDPAGTLAADRDAARAGLPPHAAVRLRGMLLGGSIRARLVRGAGAGAGGVPVAAAGVGGAAGPCRRRAQPRTYARLQGTVYLLLAGAEVDAAGRPAVMPAAFWPSRACRCRARACMPACCMCPAAWPGSRHRPWA